MQHAEGPEKILLLCRSVSPSIRLVVLCSTYGRQSFCILMTFNTLTCLKLRSNAIKNGTVRTSFSIISQVTLRFKKPLYKCLNRKGRFLTRFSYSEHFREEAHTRKLNFQEGNFMNLSVSFSLCLCPTVYLCIFLILFSPARKVYAK